MNLVRERENLRVERDIDLWIVSIDEIVEVDLSEAEVMLTIKKKTREFDFLQEKFQSIELLEMVKQMVVEEN